MNRRIMLVRYGEQPFVAKGEPGGLKVVVDFDRERALEPALDRRSEWHWANWR
jgi:hypothetical protein